MDIVFGIFDFLINVFVWCVSAFAEIIGFFTVNWILFLVIVLVLVIVYLVKFR